MANPTVPSNVPRPQQVPSSGPPTSSAQVPSNGPNGVRIKTEPGYEPQGYQPMPNYGSTVAQQRAAHNLQQKFGANASHQINQLHAQAAMGGPGGQPPRGPMNIHLPAPMATEAQRQEQADLKRRQLQYQNQQQPQQQRPAVSNTQTDGAGDWDELVAQRRLAASTAPSQVYEADMTIREQVEQLNRSMEGGGLMMPLAEQSRLPQSKKRKVAAESSSPDFAQTSGQPSDFGPKPKISQLDGNDDDDDDDDKTGIKDELFDDDDDEDAINSDLDDPDDNVIEEEQEEGKANQIMLCTYDKVARVKNKWKCTLKDGILTTGGKE